MPDVTDLFEINLSDLVDRILSHLPADTPEKSRDFVRQYYSKTPMVELQRLDPGEAAQMALNSLPFFERKTERVQIRTFTPDKTEHGFDRRCLVLEVHNDDHAFILDSMRAELIRQGFDFITIIHPVFFLKRDKNGQFQTLININETGDLPSGAVAESFIHFQLAGPPESIDTRKLEEDIRRVLGSVELVVDDFMAMDRQCEDAIKEVTKLKHQFDAAEIEEVNAFLYWLRERHYVFLGYIEYDFVLDGECRVPQMRQDAALGIFKTDSEEFRPQALDAVPQELATQPNDQDIIEITKSNRRSIVHRPVLMDYIAIKRYNTEGEVIGERRFIGMFTSMVYYQSAERIPFIRRKISRTLDRANYDPLSHNGKALKAILEFYPRDELFQIDQETLFHFSIGLMALEAKPEVRLFPRIDRYERFISAMVFIPRDRFSSYLREQIISILERHYHGKIRDFYTQLTDSPLARLHLIIQTQPGAIPDVDISEVEEQIARITNQWADALRQALIEKHGEERASMLLPVYADAFPNAYIEQQQAIQAAADIAKIEECIASDGLAIDLYHRTRGKEDAYHLKIYTYESERALSDMLPILEHFGCWVKEVRPYTISPKWQHGDILIRDFHLQLDDFSDSMLLDRKRAFEAALRRVWCYETANDSFNALVLSAGLSYREVDVIRCLSHYLRQITFPYSNSFIAEVLRGHPEAARGIINAFRAKFDPSGSNHAIEAKAKLDAIEAYLQSVKNAAEDRVIRRFCELLESAKRTNYYQNAQSDEGKPYLSIKFCSSEIPELPKPVPFAEIFVYSLRVEGIHLRGDAVARGGLRWSDRPEDFRTEVLGLVKAQMVKNAVIVPQGAKGGFVVKRPPRSGDREAYMEEGISCYKEFLCGLLDITDNFKQGDVIAPKDVIRHDGDDPYLVVAADKGTATFSDIANEVAESYDFWLGDAFASGGSAGYDHKEMGITARGAWVSVERHFMEMDKDISSEAFTVCGIGDMSGDVFGNGMLLSRQIRLIAAFNHRHIFIDPDPDPASSFKERERLFEQKGSQWSDYQTDLISEGGGVFERTLKQISLSPQAQKALGTSETRVTPEKLIQIILMAPVELLWNGGIGTYVKASHETHAEVGDRANNDVRVDANQLRCKVVGEGGNLGLTQCARIEYALAGGRINTDAIDNSAGVDCSDHEVNIKIALREAVHQGRLSSQERDALLADMTDEVAQLVLNDNRLQTQAITIAENEALEQLEPLSRMMEHLEQHGFLDRSVEFLPGGKQITERRAQHIGLTRPEIAVMLSYSKLSLYSDIKDSQMVRDDYFVDDLLRYFPEAMRERFREEICAHRLRPAIVATMITNSIINRAGITFVHRIVEESGVHPCDVARAYCLSRDAFKLRGVWSEIESLGYQLDARTQSDLFIAVQHFLETMTRWFLQHCSEPIQISETMQDYAEGIETFSACFEQLISKTLRKAFNQQKSAYEKRNVPQSLARQIASLEVMTSACDVVMVANQEGLTVETVGKVYFELGAGLRLGWLRRSARKLAAEGYWDRLAIESTTREFYQQQRRLTAIAVREDCQDGVCQSAFDRWYQRHDRILSRYYNFISDLKSQEQVTLAMLVIALRKIEAISAESSGPH